MPSDGDAPCAGSTTTSSHPKATADRVSDEDFNRVMARQFSAAADLLEVQHADRHRIRAYRRAADAITRLGEPASAVYRRGGMPALIALPAIGKTFALAITDMVELGRWRWLDRLTGEVDPEHLLTTVAGVGPQLAERLHDELGVETLEELEIAAHDGRLATLQGFGPKRVQSIRDSLAGRLAGRGSTWHERRGDEPLGSIDLLLDVDNEYRTKAADGRLPMIVPRRFNPDRTRSIPILHTSRDGRHFTALYSNTALAHELDRTDDWVVIYADAPDHGRWTVVTETRGPGTGQRAVRGALLSPLSSRHRAEDSTSS